MIHYYCDGSYKKEKNMVGCGIVRVKGARARSYFQYTLDRDWSWRHESFSIYQTLLLAERQRDMHIIIWNDGQEIVEALQTGANKNNNFGIQVVMEKLIQLRGRGYTIAIRWKKDKACMYMRKAHHTSRKYLDDTDMQQKHIEKKQSEKEQLRKAVKILKVENRMNTYILKNSNEIHFKKISNAKWCACNEYDMPFYAHKNLEEIFYHVFRKILRNKKRIQISRTYKSVFYRVLHNKTVMERNANMMMHMRKWDEEKRIQFVK